MQRGVLRYPGGSLKATPIRYLEHTAVTEIRQDHEGNYWFSTANHGVFLVRSLYTTVYSPHAADNSEMQVTSLASYGTNLYFGSLQGELFKALPKPNDTYQVVKVPIPPATGSIRRIVVTPDSLLYLFKNTLLVIDSTGKPGGFKEYPSFGGAKLSGGTG